MNLNDYHLIPAYGNTYSEESEVIEAWKNGMTFKVLNEKANYISSSDYIKYCNKIDGVIYCYNGLYVELETGII